MYVGVERERERESFVKRQNANFKITINGIKDLTESGTFNICRRGEEEEEEETNQSPLVQSLYNSTEVNHSS